MATCDPQALLNSANCFDCLTNQQLEQVQVQMLCDLVNGGLAGGPFVPIANINGITNYIAKFTGPNSLGDSVAYEVGGFIGLNITTPTSQLEVFAPNGASIRLSRDTGSFRGDIQWGRNNGGTFQSAGMIDCIADSGTNKNGAFRFFTSDGAGTLVTRGGFVTSTGVFFLNQAMGVGTTVPKSFVDIYNNVTIGRTWVGVNAAPNDSLVVEGQIGVGTFTPNANSLIDLVSTTKGFKLPTMTSAQKGAIANTAGLMVFDTDLGKACVNSGAGWQTITSV